MFNHSLKICCISFLLIFFFILIIPFAYAQSYPSPSPMTSNTNYYSTPSLTPTVTDSITPTTIPSISSTPGASITSSYTSSVITPTPTINIPYVEVGDPNVLAIINDLKANPPNVNAVYADKSPCYTDGIVAPPITTPDTTQILYQVCVDADTGKITSNWTATWAYVLQYIASGQYNPSVTTTIWSKNGVKPAKAMIYGGTAMAALLHAAMRFSTTGSVNGGIMGIWSELNPFTTYLRAISMHLTEVAASKVATTEFLHAELAVVEAQLAADPGNKQLIAKRTMLISSLAAVAVTP